MKSWRLSIVAVCGLAAFFLVMGLGAQPAQAAETYVAKLTPMNSSVAGHKVHGQVRFIVSGNRLKIRLKAKGLPPGMMHMVHLHGFVDGKNAVCPGSSADANHDGVVDLHETEQASGTTLVPLNGDPAALKIASTTYPKASKNGHMKYRKSVSLTELNKNMASTYKGASLDLTKRVVYIHGIPDGAKLPKTAASLPGVPAQITLPIACGKIVPAK